MNPGDLGDFGDFDSDDDLDVSDLLIPLSKPCTLSGVLGNNFGVFGIEIFPWTTCSVSPSCLFAALVSGISGDFDDNCSSGLFTGDFELSAVSFIADGGRDILLGLNAADWGLLTGPAFGIGDC